MNIAQTTMLSTMLKKEPSLRTQDKLSDELSDYSMEMISTSHRARKEVENFVSQSYKQHFGANLKSFFPEILCVREINSGKLIGAVGFRFAHQQKLFSECYLQKPVEQLIACHEIKPIERKKILELGNFAVENSKHIKTVITLASRIIKNSQADWTVYTLTLPIKFHFKKLDIELNSLGLADISAVNGAAADWGSYYSYRPTVYYSSVQNNMNEQQV